MMRLVILDPNAPKPYTTAPASLVGLGGTEMTIAAVAERLAKGMTVEVHQTARKMPAVVSGIGFLPMTWKAPVSADAAIVINSWKAAIACRKVNPDLRLLLWLHNVPGRHNRKMGAALRDADVTVVCVSDSHARILRDLLGCDAPDITHVYNPIPDDLAPSGIAHDRDLLFFASAPHKGLRQVFDAFRALRREIPSMRLAVANPGYMDWDVGPIPDGVSLIGRSDKDRLWQRMEGALCLFYPQTSFAETFGIVLAEANAVGCPVLVHKGLGANDEVPSSAAEAIDCADIDQVIATVKAWRASRPKVEARPEFRLSAVVDTWADLLRDRRAVDTPLTPQVLAAE